MNDFYTTNDLVNLFHVQAQTILLWRKSNKIPFIKVSQKKYLYPKLEINKLLNNNISQNETRQNIIYCRVSNVKQKDDLKKQIQLLTNYCNANGIIIDQTLSEIASGMNENRIEFNKLLDLVIKNKVDKVFITYKDRLTRFGFEYFQKLFANFGCNIIILNNPIDEQSLEQELTEDLISIVHHFSMKMYSNRRKQLKEIKAKLENNKEDNKEDSEESNKNEN